MTVRANRLDWKSSKITIQFSNGEKEEIVSEWAPDLDMPIAREKYVIAMALGDIVSRYTDGKLEISPSGLMELIPSFASSRARQEGAA